MLMIAMVLTATVTAYAVTENGTDYGYGDYLHDDEPPYDFDDEPPHDFLPQEPALGSLVITNSTHDEQPLSGAVFALYRVGEDTRLAELSTDAMGQTRELFLPQGVYNVVILITSPNHVAITDRVSTTITAGERQELTIFSVPISASPDEPPPPLPIETGRLLVTLRAHGTGELLSGAVFELRGAMNGEYIATLVTDSFGEAAIDLPANDFFLRETGAPRGFIPNPDRINVRITANRLNEVNLTSRPEPTPTPPVEETDPELGRLIVTVRAEGTRELLQGASFEVRRAIDNRLVAELTTDRFGEATVNLPPDDYFLRQTSTAQGFEFSTDRINVRIAEGAVNEISVTNRAIANEPPEQDTPPPPAEATPGRLLVTVISSQTDERLEGVVFTIHDVMTDEVIATISTNIFGESSVTLPPGDYFMRNTAMPQGYRRDMDRIPFTIRAGEITNRTVTARAIESPTVTPPTEPDPPTTPSEPAPTPPQVPTTPAPTTPPTGQPVPVTPPSTPATARQGQHQVSVVTRAEQSGNLLPNVTFGVYRATDNERIAEVRTDANGRATFSLNTGEYYLRNYAVPFGFLAENARIFFTVGGNGDVIVEVTIQRDTTIPYADYGVINLPQTGELTPILNYVMGTAFIGITTLCILGLLKLHKQNNKPRKGVKSYA